MKILYLVHQFYPEYQSGTEKFVFNTAFMAQKNGNKIKVLTYSFYENNFFSKDTEGILSHEFIYNGIPIIAIKHLHQPIDLHISLGDERLNNFARSLLASESPDLIHVGHPMRMHAFMRAAKELNIPYIITLTDFFLMCPNVILAPTTDSLCSGPEKGEACLRLCPEFIPFIKDRLDAGDEFLRNAQAVISPSKFLASKFQQEFSGLKVRVINHGISFKYLRKNNRFYTNTSPLVFAYTGNLAHHKGVHVLIKAFNGIKKENVRLQIYGPLVEPYTTQLKKIVRQDSQVIFKGPYSVHETGDILADIDVVITPSICYENYPMVIQESLASNVPVIASNLGGMSERIKDGFNGFSFTAGDHTDLQEKMDMIIRNPSLLNTLKENISTKTIIPTIEQEAYQYFRLYREL